MPCRGAWRWLCLYSLPAFCQSQPSILDAVRRRVLDNLAHLPNYTCTETIDRSTRRGRSRTFDRLDRYRIEVAYVGARELFGWPGSDKLTEANLTRMVPGTVSNGEFAILVPATFNSPGAVFGESAEELRDGRPALQYQYRVPAPGSGWILLVPGRAAPVAYHGSIRAERERLDLLEFEAVADEIPPSFGFKTVQRTVEFALVPIGDSDFLLPAHAVLQAADAEGEELKNDIRFSGCHQYAVETEIRFDSPDHLAVPSARRPSEPPVIVGPPADPIRLPGEFNAELDFLSEIDPDTAAIGDPFTAVLRRAIAKEGLTLIPAGAILHGRIARLSLGDGRRYLDLGFLYFDAGVRRIAIDGRDNTFSVWDRGLSVSSRVYGPFRGDGARLRLTTGYSLFLNSRAAHGP